MTPPKASAPPADSLQQVVAEMRASDSAGFIRIGAWANRIEALAASAQVREVEPLASRDRPWRDHDGCPFKTHGCPGAWHDWRCPKCAAGLEAKPAAEPAPVAQDVPIVGYRIRWNSGDTFIAATPCHRDDGTSEPLCTIADHARREAQWKEVARKNRDGFEEYERRYYLEVNAREALEASLAACRADADGLDLLRRFVMFIGDRRAPNWMPQRFLDECREFCTARSQP